MSLRLEMLQVARLAPRVLGESAALIRNYILNQLNEDGGFKDRAGSSDLYYSVFGIDGLLALQADLPRERMAGFLESFGDGANLDFVHLCCLARGWAGLSRKHGLETSTERALRISARVEEFRCEDGGYHPVRGAARGTAYGCFLGYGAYQDLNLIPHQPSGLLQCLETLATPDGAWANERGLAVGATNASAAVITLLHNMGRPIPPQAGDWLLARHRPEGGFLAAPGAPIPDLLSTATALHALAALERDISKIKEPCLDFVDSLWTNEGAFHGHWGEELLDCEYTYYGLLALGHLSL